MSKTNNNTDNKSLKIPLHNRHIAQRISDNNISCTSMIVTLFGDVMSQHGGWIWLGSLIDACEPFGFNERLVRTAVYRLVQNDWLQVNKVGRRSYYCFTDSARNHYEKAARRIYAGEQPEWDGKWTIVTMAFVPDDKREALRKSLVWQGFNTLAPGMYAHPSSDRTSLDETIFELGIAGDVVVLSANTEEHHSQAAIKKLVQERWDLSQLEKQYSDFLNYYRPLCQQLAEEALDNRESFLLRSLLIHDYRRILLRDPDFPDTMLPNGWTGHEAQALVKRTYSLLAQSSAQFIMENLENAQGPLPKASKKFFQRFGGV